MIGVFVNVLMMSIYLLCIVSDDAANPMRLFVHGKNYFRSAAASTILSRSQHPLLVCQSACLLRCAGQYPTQKSGSSLEDFRPSTRQDAPCMDIR